MSSQEIDSVKAKFTQLEEVESVNISTLDDVKSRRLSIVVTLNSDVDFDSMKKISNEALLGFSEKNLNYYDIHITIDSKNDESDIYPKMGTRVKPSEGETNLEFVWSR